MIIKYDLKFKRILVVAVQDKGKMGSMRVGEVTNFIACPNGDLNIIAWIWPQTPKQLIEQISKNPSMMGMTAETLPTKDQLIFPDGTVFEEKDDETQLDEVRARIMELENKLADLIAKEGTTTK